MVPPAGEDTNTVTQSINIPVENVTKLCQLGRGSELRILVVIDVSIIEPPLFDE